MDNPGVAEDVSSLAHIFIYRADEEGQDRPWLVISGLSTGDQGDRCPGCSDADDSTATVTLAFCPLGRLSRLSEGLNGFRLGLHEVRALN